MIAESVVPLNVAVKVIFEPEFSSIDEALVESDTVGADSSSVIVTVAVLSLIEPALDYLVIVKVSLPS